MIEKPARRMVGIKYWDFFADIYIFQGIFINDRNLNFYRGDLSHALEDVVALFF